MDANEIQRLIRNLIRKGRVIDVDFDSKPPKCRVAVGEADDDGLQTNWIPWVSLAAGETREWLPLSKGEQVVLFGPMGDFAQGVAVRGFFSDEFPAPDHSPNTHTRTYGDGARISYDYATHALTADLPADATVRIVAPGAVTVQTQAATVKADDVTLDAKQTTCTGGLLVKGPFAFESGMTGKGGKDGATMKIDGGADFSRDVIAAGVSVSNHPHQAQGADALTSKPIASGA
ncbi:phage baseplate assembly protein V [Trinickia terrae]|uniref:Phage baseplate assembly protein V n=1 Tax=Trinickia terrae TaxID=2571161 RepID=A0A4V5PHH7_9BURK|nr:phage baseplate assembly protein V [Trinickia terrae]TKC83460.1 phage baseplate assembly protein V [Trinickia terrae]